MHARELSPAQYLAKKEVSKSAYMLNSREKADMKRGIGVVIPCYKVRKHILKVISNIPDDVEVIYLVDDCCPEQTGPFVMEHGQDKRVKIIQHNENKGVGGAVMTGFHAAISDGVDVIVKLDGDGQMDPCLIPVLVAPILSGEADYAKGNRFYNLEKIKVMPKMRLIGNAILSFMNKLSSGYWDIFDPTNGYTAIHRNVACMLPFKKISERYFFESDMLFRLATLRAVVVDIPMDAKYENENSNLKIEKVLFEFLFKHLRNFVKRIFYNYYLRDMSLASIELPLGIAMVLFGMAYGGYHWYASWQIGAETPAGTVMLSAMPIIIGIQFILAFIGYDIASTPRRSIRRK